MFFNNRGFYLTYDNICKTRDAPPPRAADIPLSTKHLLPRLPVYLLITLPFFILANYLPNLYGPVAERPGGELYSENITVMFFQVLGDAFVKWIHNPIGISRRGVLYIALIYPVIVMFHEPIVYLYLKQMKKMDAEENDLS